MDTARIQVLTKGTYTNNVYHRASILLFYMQSIPIICSYTSTVLHEKYQFEDRFIGKGMVINADYLSCLNSLGAAQLDAQCARWKTKFN